MRPWRRAALRAFVPVAVACLLASCGRSERDVVQGYVEGEFVYVASPLAGMLEELPVQRGAQVDAGDPLFALECGAEQAEREQAVRRLAQGEAQLEDAKKGSRPSEVEAVEQQLEQARAALELSEKDFARQEKIFRTGAIAAREFDASRATRDQDRHRVAQLEAQLQSMHLASRDDQIVAAEANVRALTAALARADWALAQKRQAAPTAGLVFDTLYRQGEWVPAGRPVISLLPPGNIKVRAFVPEPRIGAIHVGDTVRVAIDGVVAPVTGKVSFISPKAEYTPPVIYSQESRGKLVFMIEAVFDPAVAAKLHPGQPVDVQFGS
jgi:HlyD family secretion protein